MFPNEDAMFNDWPSPTVTNLSAAPSPAACQAMCEALAAQGKCFSYIYYSQTGGFGPMWDGNCFARTDTTWSPTSQHDTYSGYCVPPPPVPNVWVADLSATPLPACVTQSNDFVLTMLFSPDGGRSTQRAIRARYPNANPEIDLFPTGWSGGGARSAPACNTTSNVVHVPLPGNYGPAEFADYYFGQGGTCDRFETGEWVDGTADISYWCQPNGRTAGCEYFVNSPTSIALTPAELPHAPYKSDLGANGAVFQ
jgi:hypothetical protein